MVVLRLSSTQRTFVKLPTSDFKDLRRLGHISGPRVKQVQAIGGKDHAFPFVPNVGFSMVTGRDNIECPDTLQLTSVMHTASHNMGTTFHFLLHPAWSPFSGSSRARADKDKSTSQDAQSFAVMMQYGIKEVFQSLTGSQVPVSDLAQGVIGGAERRCCSARGALEPHYCYTHLAECGKSMERIPTASASRHRATVGGTGPGGALLRSLSDTAGTHMVSPSIMHVLFGLLVFCTAWCNVADTEQAATLLHGDIH